MKLTKEPFGITRDGNEACKYTLTNQNGMEVELSDFGALILAIRIPVNGEMRDVCLGYDTLDEYYNNGAGFGAYVGRNGNRIAGAQVTIDGIRYELEKNNNGNNLHSGEDRSYYKFYQSVVCGDEDGVCVEFSRVSPHMEQGFPGNLQQSIRYVLTDSNELIIKYRMVSDRETVINPTNHCYFNLQGSGDVLSHTMTLYADFFLPTDDELIPTGEVRSVAGTPFDFRTPHTIGERIDDDYEPLNQGGGYDHNYCFPNDGKQKLVAELQSPDKAVTMTVTTDLCGMQVYAGNFLNSVQGKDRAIYNRRNGICFETQGWPNACNNPTFPSTIYPAHKEFKSQTTYAYRF